MVVTVVGILLFAAVATASIANGSPTIERPLLSDIPGFGATDDTGARDEAIALWEAFKREELVQSCMAAAGFGYKIEVSFPAGAVVDVASYLTVEPSLAPVDGRTVSLAGGKRAANWNDFLSLNEGDRDRYALTLYGERAIELIAVNESGALPDGRSDFARGGCVGDAEAAIPGIWALRRAMFQDLETARTDVFFSTVDDGSFRACAKSMGLDADSPGDVEQAIAGASVNLEVGEEILARCSMVWENATAAARITIEEKFVEERRDELEVQRGQYERILDTAKADEAFVTYVADITHYLQTEFVEIPDDDPNRG